MSTSRINVIMFQLPSPEFTTDKYWGNFPWGAAMLKAMAHKEGLSELFSIEILSTEIANHAGDDFLIEYLSEQRPDVLCATLYLWNAERSLYIAAQLKQRLPKLTFMVGGPEVCEDSTYILNHPAIDYGCIGEGEDAFVAMLRTIGGEHKEPGLPGTFCRRDGITTLVSGRSAIEDLLRLPSPLEVDLDLKNAPVVSYETMRGCPCSCSYCMTGTVSWRTLPAARVVADLTRLKALGVKKVWLSCSNFLLHPDFFAICDELARVNHDRQMSLACCCYAEQVSEDHARALRASNFTVVQTGLQTVNAPTLKSIDRPPFNEERFVAGLSRLGQYGIDFLVDVIVGLPGETSTEIDTTIALLEKHRIKKYRLFRLRLLPGTQLRKEAARYGIVYSDAPPYHIVKSSTLSETEIEVYSNKGWGQDLREPCFDYVTAVVTSAAVGETAPDRECLSVPPVIQTIHGLRISGRIDHKRAIDTVGRRLAANIVLHFSNLDQSLTALAGLTGAIWTISPHTCLKPIFAVRSSADLERVNQAGRHLSDWRIRKKTIIKDASLTIPAGSFADFTIYDRFHIDSSEKAEQLPRSSSPKLLITFSPDLDMVEKITAMKVLNTLDKEVQFEVLSDYVLRSLCKENHVTPPLNSILPPVELGCSITIGEEGDFRQILVQTNATKLELGKLQLVCLKAIGQCGPNP
jgi:hypothetical protein